MAPHPASGDVTSPRKPRPVASGAPAPQAAFDGSFDLFARARRARGGPLPYLSSGINLLEAAPPVVDLIEFATRHGVAYRDYSPPQGLPSSCQAVTWHERQSGAARDTRVVLTTGGACAIETLLRRETAGVPPRGARADLLIVGHAYAVFSKHGDALALRVAECVDDSPDADGMLPSVNAVLDAVRSLRPRVIVLCAPNNPSGEEYGPADLLAILHEARACGAHVLLDRVGRIVGDAERAPDLTALAADVLRTGHASIVDSLSKSESLAGYRLGLLVTSPERARDCARLVELGPMNPPTVLAVAVPFIYLARTWLRRAEPADTLARRAARFAVVSMRDVAPDAAAALRARVTPDALGAAVAAYDEHHRAESAIVAANAAYAVERLRPFLRRVSLRRSGFNFAVELEPFVGGDAAEAALQSDLAYRAGVQCLTERCFRRTPRRRRHFWIRVSAAAHSDEFARGVDRLAGFIEAGGARRLWPAA